MKILICIPKCQISVGDWAEWAAGPAYVSAALKAAGHCVINVNFILEDRSVRETLESVMEDNEIEAIAVGDLVSHWDRIKDIIDTAKSINPLITAIIGGGFVTHSPIEAMELIPSADYGVIGEGEITVCELVKMLACSSDVSNVPGIVYRTRGGGNLVLPHCVKIFPTWIHCHFRIMMAFTSVNCLWMAVLPLSQAVRALSLVPIARIPAESRFACAHLIACSKRSIGLLKNTI